MQIGPAGSRRLSGRDHACPQFRSCPARRSRAVARKNRDRDRRAPRPGTEGRRGRRPQSPSLPDICRVNLRHSGMMRRHQPGCAIAHRGSDSKGAIMLRPGIKNFVPFTFQPLLVCNNGPSLGADSSHARGGRINSDIIARRLCVGGSGRDAGHVCQHGRARRQARSGRSGLDDLAIPPEQRARGRRSSIPT